MGRQQAAKTKHTDSESGIVRRSNPAVVAKRSSVEASKRSESESLERAEVNTDWRFHFAALLRVSDNLVSRAVGAYDRMFGLDERDESEIHFEFGKKLDDSVLRLVIPIL